jgi:SAM-dependent methyltransferase
MPDLKTVFYPETRFGGFTDVDSTVVFFTRVNALVGKDAVVLDVGCGRGAAAQDKVELRRNLRTFKGRCRRVIGIDVDDAGSANPFLDEFRRIEGGRWPLDDGSIDVAVVDNVLEHVPDPDIFFSECRRVIKPGGYLCIRTPNVFSYFGVAAKLFRGRAHDKVLKAAQKERSHEDVFPAVYRCNSRGKLRSMLVRNGFDACVYGYEAEPSYFSFSSLAYFLGVVHQRFSPRACRIVLFAFARRGS